MKHAYVSIIAMLLLGCLPSQTRVMDAEPRVMTEAADKVAEAMAHNRSMAYVVEHSPKAPVAVVKPNIELQGKALEEAKTNQEAATAEYAKREAVLVAERDAWKAKYEGEVNDFREFRGKLSVRIALWVERLLTMITIVWAVAGVAGAFLTACGGFGFAGLFSVGRWLLAFLPFANVFTGFSHMLEDHWPGMGKKWVADG